MVGWDQSTHVQPSSSSSRLGGVRQKDDNKKNESLKMIKVGVVLF